MHNIVGRKNVTFLWNLFLVFNKTVLIINSYDACWSFLENLFIEGFPRAN